MSSSTLSLLKCHLQYMLSTDGQYNVESHNVSTATGRLGVSTLEFMSRRMYPPLGRSPGPWFGHVLMESSCAKGHSLLHSGSAGMLGAAHTCVPRQTGEQNNYSSVLHLGRPH